MGSAILRRFRLFGAATAAFIMAVIFSFSVQIASAASAAQTYTYWFLPANNATDMDWTIRPETDPSPQQWFWSNQWWHHNATGGATAGYAGLQTVGSGINDKMAIFSIWDATSARTSDPNAWCQTFGGEGIGYSCRLPLKWEAGRDYAFSLKQVAANDWRATVTDNTNTVHELGIITVPNGWSGLYDQTVDFTEYYGPTVSACSNFNYARAKFSAPKITGGTLAPTSSSTNISATGCESMSKISAVPDASYHEVSFRQGLTGSYYKSNNLTNLGLTRTDAAVNFDWGNSSPASVIPRDNFSTRWTGKFQAAKTEAHTFCAQYDDGARLWVGGQQLVNDYAPHSLTERCGTTNLTAGQFYDVTLEYVEYSKNASVKLSYSTPTTAKQVIPATMLRAQ